VSGEKSPIANVTANVNHGLTTPPIIPKPRPDWRERWMAHPRRAMLFDLDGTLLDTAPDLAAQQMCCVQNTVCPRWQWMLCALIFLRALGAW